MENTRMAVLVICEHVNGSLTNPSKELLTLARSLTAGRIDALVLTKTFDETELATYGANRVLVPDLSDASARVAGVVAECAYEAVSGEEYGAVLNVSNYRGREVAAHLAMRIGSGAAVDVSECSVSDGQLQARKTVLAGSWKTTFRITRGTPVIAVRPSSVEAAAAPSPTQLERVDLPVPLPDSVSAVRVVESKAQPTARIPLAEARVVVCGGRGTDGDFGPVEELAELLGGAVGATRVACDEGWCERGAQIGQTGVSVAPKLYVGVGVSGAIHHTCGIQAAEVITAVVDDPDAPIVEVADYVVIGDVNEVIPAAISHLRSLGPLVQ